MSPGQLRHATFELHSSRRRGIEGCERCELRIADGTDFLTGWRAKRNRSSSIIGVLYASTQERFFLNASRFMQILPCLIGKLCVKLCSYWAPGGPAAHGWLVGFAVVHMSFDSISWSCFFPIKIFFYIVRFHQIPCVWFFDSFLNLGFISDMFSQFFMLATLAVPTAKKHLDPKGTCWTCRRVMSARPWVSRCYTSPAVVICRCDLWYQWAIWNWTKLRHQRHTVNTQIHLFLQVWLPFCSSLFFASWVVRLLLNASNMVFLELSIYNVLTAMSLLQLTARNAQSCTYPFSPTGRHVATTSALGTTMVGPGNLCSILGIQVGSTPYPPCQSPGIPN